MNDTSLAVAELEGSPPWQFWLKMAYGCHNLFLKLRLLHIYVIQIERARIGILALISAFIVARFSDRSHKALVFQQHVAGDSIPWKLRPSDVIAREGKVNINRNHHHHHHRVEDKNQQRRRLHCRRRADIFYTYRWGLFQEYRDSNTPGSGFRVNS